ncbi:hypothetical protein D3C85_1011210 [compost metagenome]
MTIEAGLGVHHIAAGARQPPVGGQIGGHVATAMQPRQVEVGKGGHRSPHPVELETGEGGALYGKGDEVAVVEDLPHQLAVFQVVAGQRLLVGVEQLGDLLPPVRHVLDILATAKQFARHRIQAVAGKLPGGAFQGIYAIEHHAPGDDDVAGLGIIAGRAPEAELAPSPQPQPPLAQFGAAQQQAKVEVHHVPADHQIRIVQSEPVLQRAEQGAFIRHPLDLGAPAVGIHLRVAYHDDPRILLAVKTDREKRPVHGTLHVQRHPGESRHHRLGRAACLVHLPVALPAPLFYRPAIETHAGGDEALHQEALRQPDIRLEVLQPANEQQLDGTVKGAQGGKIAAHHRAAVEGVHGQAAKPPPHPGALEQFGGFGHVALWQEEDRLLPRHHQSHRPLGTPEPHHDFGRGSLPVAATHVPTVAGQDKTVERRGGGNGGLGRSHEE